ncbi:hypothetical protein [Brevibacterium gallinarum]|uniref:Glycosyltransferase family 92 protein n=1 Tax=Brevibacterium gallinarum TaxID=2762220 RepID=A0ABR8WWG3_9MICO|nr:hypothetical protein [Brevibacterium gallinarum]MBD8021303.1 hypothetical protein [Brevibacterium gallinarum]
MITVAEVSSAVLSKDSPVVRAMPRPVEHRMPGYEEAFDDRTLICDAFAHGRDIVLSGPPLLNLLDAVRLSKFRLNGVLPLRASLSDLWKTQRSRLTLPGKSAPSLAARKALLRVVKPKVTFRFAGRRYSLPIQPNEHERFAGKRILYTLQKDNRLEWIQDWIRYYVAVHGIDGVIIYDNNSSGYSIEELRAAVAAVDGIDEGVVLSWPFPYGPGAARDDMWDSDFCQYTALEHMRWRFAADAAAVINADVDELIVCDDRRSVFDHLSERTDGALFYRSFWIESVSSRDIEDDRRFDDFIYRSRNRQVGTPKWTVVPGRLPKESQLCVHSIKNGPKRVFAEGVQHRHFFPMNTDWKRKRAEVTAIDPDVHFIDEPLVVAMRDAFGGVREPHP